MAYPGSLWGTWYKNRDPHPPIEPAVLLMGCAAWSPSVEIRDKPGCRVCGDGIRHEDVSYCCLACLRVEEGVQRHLDWAVQDTDPDVGDARADERAEHEHRLVLESERLQRSWRREERTLWAERELSAVA